MNDKNKKRLFIVFSTIFTILYISFLFYSCGKKTADEKIENIERNREKINTEISETWLKIASDINENAKNLDDLEKRGIEIKEFEISPEAKKLFDFFGAEKIEAKETTPEGVEFHTAKVKKGKFAWESEISNSDLLKKCADFGVSRDECIVLIAITGKESKYGWAYSRYDRKSGKIISANTAGLEYHNASGFKGKGCSNAKCGYPDKNGFYLKKYSNWSAFWDDYIAQMRNGYFDKNCSTPECIGRYYLPNSTSWIPSVKSNVRYIKNLIK